MLQRKPCSTGCQESCFETGSHSCVGGSAGINWLGFTDGISLPAMCYNMARCTGARWGWLFLDDNCLVLEGPLAVLEPVRELRHQQCENCGSVTSRENTGKLRSDSGQKEPPASTDTNSRSFGTCGFLLIKKPKETNHQTHPSCKYSSLLTHTWVFRTSERFG